MQSAKMHLRQHVIQEKVKVLQTEDQTSECLSQERPTWNTLQQEECGVEENVISNTSQVVTGGQAEPHLARLTTSLSFSLQTLCTHQGQQGYAHKNLVKIESISGGKAETHAFIEPGGTCSTQNTIWSQLG